MCVTKNYRTKNSISKINSYGNAYYSQKYSLMFVKRHNNFVVYHKQFLNNIILVFNNFFSKKLLTKSVNL